MTQPWPVLGIERTGDVRAIRRAYARRLKAMNVEAEPQAFMRLREALEEALAWASRAWTEPAGAAAADDPYPPLAQFDVSEAEAEAALAAARADGTSDRFGWLEHLLFADPERRPDEAALTVAVRAILEHSEMAHVDHGRAVEGWLAQALAEAVPRSDPLLPMVVAHFGWEERAGQWDQPWDVDLLVDRARALALAEAVSQPGHRLHKAWAELTRADARRPGLRRFTLGRDVRQLLGRIRGQCPAAMEWLNPARVALWEQDGHDLPRVPRPIAGMILAGWVVFAVTQLLSVAMPDAATPPAGPPPIPAAPRIAAEPGAALAPVLDDFLDGDAPARLRAANPALHATLEARWREARDRHEGAFQLDADLRALVDRAVAQGLRGGSDGLQLAYWQLHRDRLVWLRDGTDGGTGGCARYPEGVARLYLPPELRRRQRSVLGRALLEPPPAPAPRSEDRRFSIRRAVFADARRRSGLAETRFRGALQARGTPEDRCRADIALVEAALALEGRERARFLREMSQAL
ncbi:hypothetical protein [Sphingosinicella terrae]|uniref:hypothetical protein n=1 Tax=Sphingosinicella terrae TaxID=2172047 RepID=UPI000E0D162F|nr:hypothetical protein [Sphingosinicella terrae]